jgi:signal transduction histidine kinase
MIYTAAPQPGVEMALLPNNIPHLLVVDDERINHDILAHAFYADYVIHHVYNGHDALEMIAAHPYDVILLDVMMPIMSGFEVLAHLRHQPETADLPVILMSAMTDSEFIARGLTEGANDYLTKPFDMLVVRARVRTQIELKKLSDERKRTIEQLQQLQELRDHLFKIASHDLKNPLSNLRLAFQELRYLTPTTADAEPIQNIIEMSLHDLQIMIDDFMDAAALQNGKLRVTLDCVEVEDSLLYVINQFLPGARRKQIELSLQETDTVVIADPQRLTQILGNLVSNAIKYSPPNSAIRLWAEARGKSRVRIFVADEGPGIPENERHLLFKEFSKLSPRPTGGEGSTGLGLWIVKQLVLLLKGQIGVEFPPGGGSIFWIDLPACTSGSAGK